MQLGTAFLACHEAGVADAYKEALVSSREDQTRLTSAFSGRLARGIANRFLTGMESREETILPFPLQNALTRPLWAGQGLRLARRSSAAELVERLRTETEAAVAEQYLNSRSAAIHGGLPLAK